MKYISLLLFLLVFVGTKAQVGTCGSGGANIGGPYSDNTTLSAAIVSGTTLTTVGQEVFSPALIGGSTIDLYYKVNGGTLGSISFRLFFSSIPTSSFVYSGVSANLYPLGNCTTPVVSGTTDMAHISTNPNIVFNGVSNVDYILKLTLTIPNGTTLGSINVGYYYHNPPVTCNKCQNVCPSNQLLSASDKDLTTAFNSLKTNLDAFVGSLYNIPIPKGQSNTICLPVTIPAQTTTIGFRQYSSSPIQSCTQPVISYVLKDQNCNPVTFNPTRPNANNFGSGFNPEYDNPPAGNYILCVKYDNTNGTCETISPNTIGTYIATSSVTVPCGTVGFDWKSGQTIPTGDNFTTCQNTNYQLKANAKATATEYIAPGFGIVLGSGTMNIDKVEISEGGGAYQNIGTIVNLPYSSPNYAYNIRINGTVVSGPVTINIVDHATGTVVASAPYSANVVIPIPTGTLKGTATFSGPGVSNYQLDYPSAGKTDYTANGYAIFNPSIAGNGTHTITYTWNNGTSACGTATKTVTVSGCPLPPVTCATCSSATCKVVVSSGTDLSDARLQSTADITAQKTTNNISLNIKPGEVKTVCVPVTIPADATDFGFKHAIPSFNNANLCINGGTDASIKRTYTLQSSNCSGVNIPPKTANGGGVGSGFNPEWKVAATAGAGTIVPGNYIFCLTVELTSNSNCDFTDLVLGYYTNGTIPVVPPCPTEKTYISLDWKQVNPFIAWNAKSYDCSSPIDTVFKNVDINTISTGGQIQPFPGFKMDMTMNTGSDTQTSMLVSVNGVPYSYYGPAGTAPTGVLDWGKMATGTQEVMEPYIPKGATITLSICDTRAANQSFDYTIWDYATGNTLKTGTATPKSGTCTTITFTLTSPTMTWKIDGASTGVIDHNNGSCSFDPKALTAGNHTLQYTFTNGAGCTVTGNLESFTTTGGPTITPTTPLSVCAGITSTTFTYTSTGAPTKYSIDWDAAANTAGFADVVDAILTTTPQTISLSSSATSGTYTGTLTVKNASGCTSTGQNISVTLSAGPSITGISYMCIGESIQLNGSGTKNTTTPWNSATPTVATVNSSGTVLGVTSGTSVITYKDNNGCSSTQTVTVNGNPTLTANPTSILVSATSAITVAGGSGTAASSNAWVSTSTTNATIVGAGQSATVTGVAVGNTNIIYTDNKGCDDTIQVTVTIPGCKTISNPSPAQILCQGSDPAPFTVSTSETAANGIYFVVYPAIFKPADAAAIYSGIGSKGAAISNKLTASTGTATIDLPPLGSVGSFPVSIAGDYYVYAILNPVPSDVNCRPYAEIKVTIKDSIIPVITSGAVASNASTFTWNDIPTASKFGIDTARSASIITPSVWKPAGTVINSTGGSGNTFTFSNIPLGQTAHIKITPQDNTGSSLACSNTAMSSVINPNCTKPIPMVLTSPVAVCEGASLSILGSLDPNSVPSSYKWRISPDGINWSDVSGPDFDVTTLPSTISISKTKFSMNNNFVKLVVTDKATGVCKDSTLPVKILVNELPNASLSINPDPAQLCIGASQIITVTFLGNKGTPPYIFDYTLDGVVKKDSSLLASSVLAYDFTTNDIIKDSTFVLTNVTDKNGCSKTISSNNSVSMQVIASPTPVFTADQTIGCYPFKVIFTDKSTILNKDVEWDFGDGTPVSKDLGYTSYTFKKPGDFTITFKSTLNGCSDTMMKTDYIHVKERPIAQFSSNITNINMLDPEIQLKNTSSTNSVYFKWIFGDGSQVVSTINPKHTFVGQGNGGLPDPGKYVVELYAYVNQDCWDSTSTTITIDDEQIYYIPNTFTPNGDEKNNVFQPIFTTGYDPQNYHFYIYNRWGELIFESNNAAIGWDGTYGNKLLTNETYTWKLQFKERLTEKEHYLTGHVNLIR